MNIKYLMFLFFIKILHIIPNTLYIDEDIFVKDDFVNLDWLKEAVLSNDNIVISKIDQRENEKIEDFNYSYDVKDESNPSIKTTVTEIYKKQLNYIYEGKFLKINIDNTSNLKDLIKNIKDVKNKKTDSKGNLINLDKNISKIDVKIDVYNYKKDKKNNYEYIVLDKNTNNVIKQLKFNENPTDNPTIFKINADFYCFFSYFQCNNNGVFENSKIEYLSHVLFLKENDINFKRLFKNSSIGGCTFYNFKNKIINCDQMFLNCEKIKTFMSIKEYLFYGKSIFENCKNLAYCYDTYNNGEKRYIPIKKNLLKKCEKVSFKDDVHFVINKDTEEEDLEDVFYNVSNNSEENEKLQIYLKIEKDTKIQVELDKIFNNHKLEEIIIEDNGKVAIFGSKHLLKTNTLKKIKIIVKEKNKEKNIEEKNYVLDLTDKELMKYLKEEKHLYDIIKFFISSPIMVNDSIEEFNKKREEKRKKEELNNNINNSKNSLDNKNINNENAKCCLCFQKCCNCC